MCNNQEKNKIFVHATPPSTIHHQQENKPPAWDAHNIAAFTQTLQTSEKLSDNSDHDDEDEAQELKRGIIIIIFRLYTSCFFAPLLCYKYFDGFIYHIYDTGGQMMYAWTPIACEKIMLLYCIKNWSHLGEVLLKNKIQLKKNFFLFTFSLVRVVCQVCVYKEFLYKKHNIKNTC